MDVELASAQWRFKEGEDESWIVLFIFGDYNYKLKVMKILKFVGKEV